MTRKELIRYEAAAIATLIDATCPIVSVKGLHVFRQMMAIIFMMRTYHYPDDALRMTAVYKIALMEATKRSNMLYTLFDILGFFDTGVNKL